MPRKVEIVIPSYQTDELVAEIKQLHGLVGLRVQHDVSLQPPGDLITVEVTNRAVNRLLRLLDKRGVGRESSSSISTSEPFSLISAASARDISQDTNDVPWEEMRALIQDETNMNTNTIVLMVVAGAIAAVGIATNALHIVIAAMVIAPGFQPIMHIALGAVAQGADWRNGLANTAKGYAALIIGAAATGFVLQALGIPPLGYGKSSYLPVGSLVSYWTKITATSILVVVLASIAGAVMVASRRSVLTSGVTIALALVPSATLFSLGLVSGQLDVAGKGLLRWVIEVGLIFAVSALVLR